MKFHSPPILRVQSCLTDAVIVILSDYCFTDTHLKGSPGRNCENCKKLYQ